MSNQNKALLAAGCFWGVQAYFDQVPGVISSLVGYTGGHTKNPTYEAVCSQTTGQAEAIEITFDPNIVSYEVLLRHFFRMHDPTQLNRQGPDIGNNYRSAIFYLSAEQKNIAKQLKAKLASSFEQPIVTEITEASKFYRAEDYHQKFSQRTGHGACSVEYAPI